MLALMFGLAVLITALTVVDFAKALHSPTKVVRAAEGYVEVAI